MWWALAAKSVGQKESTTHTGNILENQSATSREVQHNGACKMAQTLCDGASGKALTESSYTDTFIVVNGYSRMRGK